MADDLLDFLPLFPDDDEAAILARMRAWANEGLDPEVDADLWVDTREGSHWHVCVMPNVRENARLYDLAGTEAVAAAFVVWAWGEYLDDHAEPQDIVRLAATPAAGDLLFSGPEGSVISAGIVVGVEPVTPDDDAPEYEVTTGGMIDGTGGLLLPAIATEAGVAGNVGVGAVTEPSTALPADVAVTNEGPMVGGTDPETDDALRGRVLDAFRGKGAGNVRDYVRWAREWEGVGRATVIPLWAGPGTVKVIIMDADGNPVSAGTVAALQADLDPVPGMGAGTAPISAIVTVTTATARPITVDATVEFEEGFSLDGFGGSVALREEIATALRDYIEKVEPGGEIVVAQVAGRIATVDGVHDARLDVLDGDDPPVNLAIDDDPAEAPQLGTVTLVEADL